MQELSLRLRASGKTIGFVPTMGYLHQGHLSLLHAAKQATDISIVSIFVNPTQFGPNEDFNKYPRDEQRDLALLAEHGCDYAFLPSADEIYPSGFSYSVDPGEIATMLEGAIRPGHFAGVATIVNILFNVVQPFSAFFGQKDAQQCSVISAMVNNLRIPVKVVICPVIREQDGLAMSSRNIYLSPEQRAAAPALFRALLAIEVAIKKGEHTTSVLRNLGLMQLDSSKEISPDYLEIVNSATFRAASTLQSGCEYFILVAARLGKTRLIDNIIITL